MCYLFDGGINKASQRYNKYHYHKLTLTLYHNFKTNPENGGYIKDGRRAQSVNAEAPMKLQTSRHPHPTPAPNSVNPCPKSNSQPSNHNPAKLLQ